MSLNIKNERTHSLVRELASISGMSQTAAVEDAVRRRLDELTERPAETVDARVEALMSIAAEISHSLPSGAFDNSDEWLYNDQGLPN